MTNSPKALRLRISARPGCSYRISSQPVVSAATLQRDSDNDVKLTALNSTPFNPTSRASAVRFVLEEMVFTTNANQMIGGTAYEVAGESLWRLGAKVLATDVAARPLLRWFP